MWLKMYMSPTWLKNPSILKRILKEVIKMKMWTCGTLFNVLFVEPELEGKICDLIAQSTPCNCAFIAAIWFSSVEAETIALFIAKGPPIVSCSFFYTSSFVLPFGESLIIRKILCSSPHPHTKWEVLKLWKRNFCGIQFCLF